MNIQYVFIKLNGTNYPMDKHIVLVWVEERMMCFMAFRDDNKWCGEFSDIINQYERNYYCEMPTLDLTKTVLPTDYYGEKVVS